MHRKQHTNHLHLVPQARCTRSPGWSGVKTWAWVASFADYICRARLLCSSVVLLALFPSFVNQANAQSSDTTNRHWIYRLMLKDGSTVNGWIDSSSVSSIYFHSDIGANHEYAKSDIEEIRRYRGSQMKKGSFFKEDPMHDVLFSSPTGETLDMGEVYIGDLDFLVTYIAAGITDWITVDFATFLINPRENIPWDLGVKFRLVHTDDLSISLGAETARLDPEKDEWIFQPGISATVGRSAKFTLGLSNFVYFSRDPVSVHLVTLVVGADIPLSRRLRLVTENWFLFGDGSATVQMLGLRYMAGDHIVAQAGVMHVPNVAFSDIPFLPILGLSYHFGVGDRVDPLSLP